MELPSAKYVELYSELAMFCLEYNSLDNVWTENSNGDEVMTEEKQNEFNDIVDNIETILISCMVVRWNSIKKEDI